MDRQDRLYFNRNDYTRITALLENLKKHNKMNKPHYRQFLSEINNSVIVEDDELPEDAVSMNSFISYRYTGQDKIHKALLVYPADSGGSPDNVSILSPLGLALIGRRKDASSEYTAPGGIYRIEITDVGRVQKPVAVQA